LNELLVRRIRLCWFALSTAYVCLYWKTTPRACNLLRDIQQRMTHLALGLLCNGRSLK